MADQQLPEGFLEVFGPFPEGWGDARRLSAAQDKWRYDLIHFKRKIDVPDGFTQRDVDACNFTADYWDMGPVLFYEGRNGVRALFNQSALGVSIETTPYMALRCLHHLIPTFQQNLLEAGIVPQQRHPRMAGFVWDKYVKS